AHDQSADDQQRPASPAVHRQDRDYGEDRVGGAHDDRLQHGTVGRSAEVAEHQRGVVEHGVDADELLEYRQEDAYDDHGGAEGEQRQRGRFQSTLDLGDDRSRVGLIGNAAQPLQGALVL